MFFCCCNVRLIFDILYIYILSPFYGYACACACDKNNNKKGKNKFK